MKPPSKYLYLVEVVHAGELFIVPSVTEAKIIKRTLKATKVRMLEGVDEGKEAWVSNDAIVK